MSFDQNFFFDSSGKVVATEGLTTVRRPWEVRASSRYQGRYYFFNLDTGASEWSLDKTEIVGAPESKSFDAGGGGSVTGPGCAWAEALGVLDFALLALWLLRLIIVRQDPRPTPAHACPRLSPFTPYLGMQFG